MVIKLELTKETLIDKPLEFGKKATRLAMNKISMYKDSLKGLKDKRIKIVDKD